jgi:hypothetical protein
MVLLLVGVGGVGVGGVGIGCDVGVDVDSLAI